MVFIGIFKKSPSTNVFSNNAFEETGIGLLLATKCGRLRFPVFLGEKAASKPSKYPANLMNGYLAKLGSQTP